jgi:hypothetical protein
MNLTFWTRLARLARSLRRGSALPPTRSPEVVAPPASATGVNGTPSRTARASDRRHGKGFPELEAARSAEYGARFALVIRQICKE